MAGRLTALLLLPWLLLPAPRPAIADDSALIDAFVKGNMTFIFYHELGHAIISEYQLPVLGKEEDAVDAFATMMMVEGSWEDTEGGEAIYAQAIQDLWAAATGWQLMGQMGEISESAMADEHSLDTQRFYATVCAAYGADPDEFSDVAKVLEFDPAVLEPCEQRYAQLTEAWDSLLGDNYEDEDHPGPEQDLLISIEPAGSAALKPYEQMVRRWDAVPQMAKVTSEWFILDQPLQLLFAECGTVNAFFVPEERAIVMCYEFFQFFEQIAGAE